MSAQNSEEILSFNETPSLKKFESEKDTPTISYEAISAASSEPKNLSFKSSWSISGEFKTDASNRQFVFPIYEQGHKKNLFPKAKGRKPERCREKFCTCGLSPNQSQIVSKVMTTNNIEYLHQLSSFDYQIKQKKQPNGKSMIMYICQYNGNCGREFERCWNLLDH
jgi:hypothetical protein